MVACKLSTVNGDDGLPLKQLGASCRFVFVLDDRQNLEDALTWMVTVIWGRVTSRRAREEK